jgi:hypothetical protein
METFGWTHFSTIGTLLLSLLACGVAMWNNRKTDRAALQQVEQSAGCRYDHEGIRGILVSQGAALTELVKQQGAAVAAFSELAHNLTLNHRDIITHHKDVTRILGDISTKLEKQTR